MFADLNTKGLEKDGDFLGSGGPLATDIYKGIIKLAYAGSSAGGAKNVQLLIDVGGREYRETIYVTNRNGQNFYMRDDKKIPLPGFSIIDNICMLATEEPLAAQELENKVVKVYDFEEKKELPQEVPVLTGLLNKPIALAIEQVLENKNAKGDDGEYRPTAEERSFNTIVKAFHSDTMLTVTEALNGLEEGEFHAKWLEQNKDKVRDKRKIKDGTGTASSGSSGSNAKVPTPATSAAPKRSLFGKKKED